MAAASPRSPSGRLPPGGGRAVLAGQRPTGRLARRELTYIYICIYMYIYICAVHIYIWPRLCRARPERVSRPAAGTPCSWAGADRASGPSRPHRYIPIYICSKQPSRCSCPPRRSRCRPLPPTYIYKTGVPCSRAGGQQATWPVPTAPIYIYTACIYLWPRLRRALSQRVSRPAAGAPCFRAGGPRGAWPVPNSPIYMYAAHIYNHMAAALPRSASARLPPSGGRAMLAGRRPIAGLDRLKLTNISIHVCSAHIHMAAVLLRSASAHLSPSGGRAKLAGRRPTGRLAASN